MSWYQLQRSIFSMCFTVLSFPLTMQPFASSLSGNSINLTNSSFTASAKGMILIVSWQFLAISPMVRTSRCRRLWNSSIVALKAERHIKAFWLSKSTERVSLPSQKNSFWLKNPVSIIQRQAYILTIFSGLSFKSVDESTRILLGTL